MMLLLCLSAAFVSVPFERRELTDAVFLGEGMIVVASSHDREGAGRVGVIRAADGAEVWASPASTWMRLGIEVAGPVEINGDGLPDFLALALAGRRGRAPILRLGNARPSEFDYVLIGYASTGEGAWDEVPIARVCDERELGLELGAPGAVPTALLVGQRTFELAIGRGGERLLGVHTHPQDAAEWRLLEVGWNGAASERLLVGVRDFGLDQHAVLRERPLARAASGLCASVVSQDAYVARAIPGFLDAAKERPGMFAGRPSKLGAGGEVVFLWRGADGKLASEIVASACEPGFGRSLALHESAEGRVLAVGSDRAVTVVHLDPQGRATSSLRLDMKSADPVEVEHVGDVDGDGHPEVFAHSRCARPLAKSHRSNGARSGVYSTGKQAWLWPAHGWDETKARQAVEPFIPVSAQRPTLLGERVETLGDVDGDGVGDLAVTCRRDGTGVLGSLYGLSGRDGSVLWTVSASDGYVSRVCRTADLDADGIPELLVVDPGTAPQGLEDQAGVGVELRVYSGRSGELLGKNRDHQLAHGADVLQVADHDADGIRDHLVAAVPWPQGAGIPQRPDDVRFVLLCSGRGGRVLRAYECPSEDEGELCLAAPGDLDGDGEEDFLLGNAGTQRTCVLSSRTGKVSMKVKGLGTALVGLGDVNDDGVPDWAGSSLVLGSMDPDWMPATSVFACISGATGERLWVVERPPGKEEHGEFKDRECFAVSSASIPDMDGDRVREVAVGSIEIDYFGMAEGAPVRVYSGSTGALVAEIPTGGGAAAGLGLALIDEDTSGAFALAVGGACEEGLGGATDGSLLALQSDGATRWIVRSSELLRETLERPDDGFDGRDDL